jgi:hypothetical protein
MTQTGLCRIWDCFFMKSSDADESVCSTVDTTWRWALDCCWEWSRSWSCGRCSSHGWESAPDETVPRNWFVSFFQPDFCWVAIGQTAEANPFSKEMGAFDQGGWVVHTVDPNWNTGDYGKTLLLWWLRCWNLRHRCLMISGSLNWGMLDSFEVVGFCTGQWNCCNASECKREGSTPSSVHRVDNSCMHAGVTLLAWDIGFTLNCPTRLVGGILNIGYEDLVLGVLAASTLDTQSVYIIWVILPFPMRLCTISVQMHVWSSLIPVLIVHLNKYAA